MLLLSHFFVEERLLELLTENEATERRLGVNAIRLDGGAGDCISCSRHSNEAESRREARIAEMKK